jgi:OmpA-OmpF porin, OOP family
MKKIAIIITLGILLISCKNDKKEEEKIVQPIEEKTEVSKIETQKTNTTEINWDEIPDLKDIGDFPFVTAPKGLKMYNEKDGFSNFFDLEKLENYTKNGVISTTGKLGVLHFQDEKGYPYNQSLFENSLYSYFEKIGATSLYKDILPEINSENENQLNKLSENTKIGDVEFNYYNHGNYPTAVYIFKNNGKKYIVNIQSNASEGNVFIMEIKEN